jgi:hypothetical protein
MVHMPDLIYRPQQQTLHYMVHMPDLMYRPQQQTLHYMVHKSQQTQPFLLLIS